jgi:hypothetical protein
VFERSLSSEGANWFGTTTRCVLRMRCTSPPPWDASVGQFDTFDGDLIALAGKLGNPRLIIGNPNVQEPLF